MRSERTSSTVFILLVSALFKPAASITFDCKDVVDDGVKFNFGKLGGYHQVSWVRPHLEAVRNTTFKIDICNFLKLKDSDEKDKCLDGTHICAIETEYRDGTTLLNGAYPIWRNYGLEGVVPDPKVKRLKGSDSTADNMKEGVRLTIGGGHLDERKQKAVIEFTCLKDGASTRNNNFASEEDGDGKDDDSESKHPEWKAAGKTDDGVGGEIEFASYGEETDRKEDVLRLNWRTPFGCEDAASSGNDTSSGGWGFFSWFFFIVFMGLLAFVLFTAWINYTRHGARGWDLLPYSDTIRDVPYILGDWGRKIVSTLNGGGSRGGYSAV